MDLNTQPIFAADGSLAPDPRPVLFYWPFSRLFDATNHDDLYTEVRNIIQECEDEDIHWIKRRTEDWDVHLNLTPKGREVYSISYLVFNKFFGNAYVKGMILAFLTLLITGYVTTKLQRPASTGVECMNNYHHTKLF
jgi:hypothetical protein